MQLLMICMDLMLVTNFFKRRVAKEYCIISCFPYRYEVGCRPSNNTYVNNNNEVVCNNNKYVSNNNEVVCNNNTYLNNHNKLIFVLC